MSMLFESSEINGMTLSNRFVRSATWEGMATEDGECTPRLTEIMVNLAKGGIGLIISGHAYVQQVGQAGPWQLGIYKDELIPNLEKMTAAVHANGGKIVMQLAHAGTIAVERLTGQVPRAVSEFEGLADSPRRELTIAEIQELADDFGHAAKRARKAGFDGVQIHAAHGYLLSQFLSPKFNRRRDEYGGDPDNRARVLLEVLQNIRRQVGNDYPVLVKINGEDCIDDGLTLEESVQVGRMLADNGIDAIELSSGKAARKGIHSQEKEGYHQDQARRYKADIDIPLILVGGMRSYQKAEQLVNEGVADYISMCRPLIREPDLINRWRSGDLSKAACLSDNQCFKPGQEGLGIYCVTAEKQNKKTKKK